MRQPITTNFILKNPGLRKALFFILLSSFCVTSFGQDLYQTRQDGAWDDFNTWQINTGSGFRDALAGETPDNTDETITIRTGHEVNVTSTVTVDQVVIVDDANSRIIVDQGVTLTLADGTGTDLALGSSSTNGRLEISGTFIVTQGASISSSSSGRLLVNSTGVYRHAYTTSAGTIFAANWASGSTLEITGYSAVSIGTPLGLNQAFHHVVWNCTSQGGDIDLDGTLENVNGNLTISSTGEVWFLKLSENTDYDLVVDGNLTIGSTSVVYFSYGDAVATITVGGNFNNNLTDGVDPVVLAGGNGNVTLNITGNFVSNDNLFLSDGGDGDGIINVTGNFSNNAGLIDESQATDGIGRINFVGTSVQTFSSAGNFDHEINFTINSNAIVDMGNNFFEGDGTFTLSNLGTIRLGSSVGIDDGTSSGNIRVSLANRTYGATSTITYNGGSAQVTGDGLPTTIGNLVINNTNNVTLTNNNTSVTTLNMQNGKLILGALNFIVTGTNDPITGANSSKYIVTNSTGVLTISDIGNTSVLFPIGPTISSYNPVTINAGIISVDDFSVRVEASTPDVQLSEEEYVVKRTWIITEAVAGQNTDLTVTPQWNLSDEGDQFDRTQSGVGSYNGTTWNSSPTSTAAAGAGPFTQTRTEFLDFSGTRTFAVGDFNTPVPIVLMSFAAQLKNQNEVQLAWSTASELNNEYFDVEFSKDALNWTSHGTVPGAGTTNTITNYTLTDILERDAVTGTAQLYYRLKQVDFDGKYEYSPVVRVKKDGSAVISSFPNPFTDRLTIYYEKEKKDQVLLDIMDLKGNTFSSATITDFMSSGITSIETSGLPFGIYILKIQNGSTVEYRKIIKQ
jgi:hypothetical protein